MAWSANQYVKFEDERTRPARDLLAQVPGETIATAYDLGCGPGNSTELIVERFPAARVVGLDSDTDMLDAARRRVPDTEFLQADLGTWLPPEPVDLLYANAVFQWLPNHMEIFATLMDHLKPGGALAIQMPDNRNEPTHLLMEESGASGPWSAAFAGGRVRRGEMPAPSAYYDLLAEKSARLDIWHTIYNHPMANAEAIVEWVKGTGLRPYLDAAGAENREAFLEDYTARIAKAYPPMANGRVLLRFPRLFIVAIKA